MLDVVDKQADAATVWAAVLSGLMGWDVAGAPAPGVPPRGPGSTAVAWATPMQVAPVPVKLAVVLPRTPLRFATEGLKLHPLSSVGPRTTRSCPGR